MSDAPKVVATMENAATVSRGFHPAGQYPCNKCKYLDVKPPK